MLRLLETSVYWLTHGTIKKYADKILEEKEFKIIERDDHWLGNGVYFFIEDIDKAIWWSGEAQKRYKRKYGDTEDKAVLLVKNFKTQTNELFDLDSEQSRNELNDAIKIINKNEKYNFDFEGLTEDKKRAKIIEIYCLYRGYKATRFTFHRDPLPQHTELAEMGILNNERQICIYDQSLIDFDNIYYIPEEDYNEY